MSTPKKITLVAAALLVAAGLAGCSTGGSTTPTATTTVTTTPQPTASSTATTSPVDTSTPAPSSGTLVACTTANLKGNIVAGSGGAAGSTYVDLHLTNTSSVPCTIQGWPGVSFVGNGNGTQIGTPAKEDTTSAHPTVTIAAGGSTRAVLRIVQAGNYSNADCSPVQADGFRVYPPGQKASLYIADSTPACAATSVSLLTVGAFQ